MKPTTEKPATVVKTHPLTPEMKCDPERTTRLLEGDGRGSRERWPVGSADAKPEKE